MSVEVHLTRTSTNKLLREVSGSDGENWLAELAKNSGGSFVVTAPCSGVGHEALTSSEIGLRKRGLRTTQLSIRWG